jgi:hypothetical protein
MNIYEHQNLSVGNPIQDCIYTWELDGGGSLDHTTGTQVVYTAPGANPSCYDNAIIKLFTCKGGAGEIQLGTISIAINAALPIPNLPAYYVVTVSGGDCTHSMQAQGYKCDETVYGGSQSCSSCNSASLDCCLYPHGTYGQPGYICGPPDEYCDGSWPGAHCGGRCLTIGQCAAGIKDVRTLAMLDAGCCPEALI